MKMFVQQRDQSVVTGRGKQVIPINVLSQQLAHFYPRLAPAGQKQDLLFHTTTHNFSATARPRAPHHKTSIAEILSFDPQNPCPSAKRNRPSPGLHEVSD